MVFLMMTLDLTVILSLLNLDYFNVSAHTHNYLE